jgi:hypothetical protein
LTLITKLAHHINKSGLASRSFLKQSKRRSAPLTQCHNAAGDGEHYALLSIRYLLAIACVMAALVVKGASGLSLILSFVWYGILFSKIRYLPLDFQDGIYLHGLI